MSIERTRISYAAVAPTPPEVARAAALAVCARAVDRADAARLLDMLGLTGQADTPGRTERGPSHPSCLNCGRPMRPIGTKAADHPGTVLHTGHGRCATCWRHWKARVSSTANAARAILAALPAEPAELTQARLNELDIATMPRRTA